jgi:putative PIN family toxin of toxin-antitoxin system
VSIFFIIDTNVVVAGLLTAHADSPVARILDGMLSATFPFVVSEALLAEYRAVLLRPKLCKLHGLTESEVDAILTDIARHAIVLAPTSADTGLRAPDAGDQFLWDLLATRADLVLVSGDKLLLQDEAMQPRVILPQVFVAQLMH